MFNMFSTNGYLQFLIVSLTITLTSVFSLPVMRMRLCISSNDPYRLQSQCVLCHNKRFVKTVRQCTGGTYLPANVSVEEGFCMIKQCRLQMPLVPPQPYNTLNSNANINTVSTDNLYSGYESATDYQYQLPKPIRVRPPAVLHIGKPVRPGLLTGRPLLFGKRSIDFDEYD
ncbi:uncharacterized protein LOC128393642 isoform X1 [Panonychus citri]|uniref:uncharacterized protein LOC128393642 isoform X1 n=2 Tax=Panonychus citri TaxID=50023 RepID=UPI0023077C8E|nr:uncharacterized protein LOC128393642 isoform X1 [Panonychus citri]XP_053209812.1 uncharacterized protein LOC128393642 isoform X1 [Panonychus citri]XP_053209813.1 uncharacterized protein LOC128393642 isoform X1 [Panonychus citri]